MAAGTGMGCGEGPQLPANGELGEQMLYMYVCIFVAVEEEQDKDRHRDVYFKLATPRLNFIS